MTLEEEKKLKKDIAELQKVTKLLYNAATIPFLVEGAFRGRLKIAELSKLVTSSKVLTSENQAVNEAGAGSYSVLKPPDAWLQVLVSGSTFYIPVWTS